MDIRPVSGALGAEIHGVDLATRLDDAAAAGIRQALLDHLVVFFRNQPLPPAVAALARVTGRIVQAKAHDAAEVEQVLATLRAAGCAPEDLEIGRADLEDVFLEIMQGDSTKAAA